MLPHVPTFSPKRVFTEFSLSALYVTLCICGECGAVN